MVVLTTTLLVMLMLIVMAMLMLMFVVWSVRLHRYVAVAECVVPHVQS